MLTKRYRLTRTDNGDVNMRYAVCLHVSSCDVHVGPESLVLVVLLVGVRPEALVLDMMLSENPRQWFLM
jgi:hypothetical protein